MRIPGLSVWGDSIAKGIVFDETRGRYAVYRDNFVARLGRETDLCVNNYAMMGSTSDQGLAKMQGQELKEGNLAVIEFGGNDCDLDWSAACEHPDIEQLGKVPLNRFSENILAMIRKVRDAGMIPALVTPPPLISQRYFEWISKNLDPARILSYLGDVEHIYRWQERYAVAIRRIAQQESVRLLDIRDFFLSQMRFTELMCVDGIHPNEKGHDLLYHEFHGVLQNA